MEYTNSEIKDLIKKMPKEFKELDDEELNEVFGGQENYMPPLKENPNLYLVMLYTCFYQALDKNNESEARKIYNEILIVIKSTTFLPDPDAFIRELKKHFSQKFHKRLL